MNRAILKASFCRSKALWGVLDTVLELVRDPLTPTQWLPKATTI
jgi:hypothetical protein